MSISLVCYVIYTHLNISKIISPIVDCEIPLPPLNGSLGNYSHTRENATVSYQCDDGYTPSVIMTSKCTNTGIWIPPPEEHNCTVVTGKVI